MELSLRRGINKEICSSSQIEVIITWKWGHLVTQNRLYSGTFYWERMICLHPNVSF